jgi:hypothetical protein
METILLDFFVTFSVVPQINNVWKSSRIVYVYVYNFYHSCNLPPPSCTAPRVPIPVPNPVLEPEQESGFRICLTVDLSLMTKAMIGDPYLQYFWVFRYKLLFVHYWPR